jgi:hypothetical protein
VGGTGEGFARADGLALLSDEADAGRLPWPAAARLVVLMGVVCWAVTILGLTRLLSW